MIKDKIGDAWERMKNIKWYIIILTLCYGVFTWAGFTGRRLLGDDTDEKEVRTGPGTSGRNGFYHK